VGLAAVLLIPQFLGIRGLERIGGGGHPILPCLHALFVPYPIALSKDSFFWTGTDVLYSDHIYYAGTVFSVAWLAAASLALAFAGRGKTFWRNPYFAASVLALLLALGPPAGLWALQAKLPLFSKFSHPLKYVPLYQLFSLAAGAVLLEHVLRRLERPKPWRGLCVAAAALLMVYHVSFVTPSLYTFGDRPYPPLPEAMGKLLQTSERPVRVLPICPLRSPVPGYVFSLQHNFPTLFHIDSLAGYDPLVERKPEYRRVSKGLEDDFAETVRRCGVTDLVVHRTCRQPVFNGNRRAWSVESESLYREEPIRQYCDRRSPILQTDDVRVIRVDDPDPLAFPSEDRRHALPLVRTEGAVAVDVSSLSNGGPVVVNYLWYPRTRATADGVPVASAADRFGRIEAQVPRGSKTLTIRYESPWTLGLAVGLALVVAGVVGYWGVLTLFLSVGRLHKRGSREP